MVRLLINGDGDDAIDEHARILVREQYSKDNAPRGVTVGRALVPTWCDGCSERCWGRSGGYFTMCPKCAGEGKTQIGFAMHESEKLSMNP